MKVERKRGESSGEFDWGVRVFSYLCGMNSQFEMVAKTFQGLEEVLAEELRGLGALNVEPGRR